MNFHVRAGEFSAEGLADTRSTVNMVAEATARAGPRVTVIQAARQSVSLERDGVAYRFVPVSGGFPANRPAVSWISGCRRVLSAVGAAEPDVVHVHGLAAPLETRWLSQRLPRIPVLAQDHASRAPKGCRSRVQRWAFRHLGAVAFTARAQALPFLEAGVFRSDIPVFEVIEGSSTFVPGDQAQARTRCGLHGDPCVLWVGRFDDNKDPLTVLDAVERVIPRTPGVELWCLYSDAPMLGKVQSRLDASPELRKRVHLLGRIPHDRLQDFHRAADLFVLASHFEGSGFALLETLACGTTPLVTGIPPFHKITGGGAVGGLFPVGDASALAERIVRWEHADLEEQRTDVRRHFERSLSYDSIGRELAEAYETLLRDR